MFQCKRVHAVYTVKLTELDNLKIFQVCEISDTGQSSI